MRRTIHAMLRSIATSYCKVSKTTSFGSDCKMYEISSDEGFTRASREPCPDRPSHVKYTI